MSATSTRQVGVGEAAEPEGSRGWIVWSGVAACSISSFTLSVQNNSMPVAAPAIARDLGISLPDVTWVVLAYTLPVTATVIMAGRLSDLFGPRRMTMVGLGLYLFGSIACGFASGLLALLLLRPVQALGGTLIVANQLGLASRSASPSRRGVVVGMVTLFAYIGQVAGPVIGGVLTDLAGWRFLFWMNVPLALGLLVVGAAYLPRDPATPARRLDPLGALLFAGTITSLLVALNRGPIWGFTAPGTLLAAAAALALGAALAWWEPRAPAPLLDLTLLRRRPFAAAVIASTTNYLAYSGLVFLLPFYLVERAEMSTGQAGAMMLPMTLAMAGLATASGWVADRMGPRVPVTAGMLMLTGGLVWCAAVAGTGAVGPFVPALVLAGMGGGLFATPNSTSLLNTVPPERFGMVGGIATAARYIGMVTGVAFAGAVYTVVTTLIAPGDAVLGFRVGFGALAAIGLVGAVLSGARGAAEPRASAV